MEKICKEQYEKDFDEMFKLDKNGLMTNIDCYVSNLENKINNLQFKIDKFDELIETYKNERNTYKRLSEEYINKYNDLLERTKEAE